MPTSETRATAAGQILADAWIGATPIQSLPDNLFPESIGDSIAIQDEMARLIGETVSGWKVGGVPGPLVGRIYASRFYTSPANIPVREFPAPGLECEIGFRLLRDLPVRPEAYSRSEVVNAAALAFTIELTGSRYINGKFTAENDRELRALVADNAAGAGLVVGPEVARWEQLSLLDIPVDVRINGGSPLAANPREKRTEPADILVWLANDLSKRGIGLRANQYVTTGSATLPLVLKPGDAVVANYGEFGQIRMTLGRP